MEVLAPLECCKGVGEAGLKISWIGYHLRSSQKVGFTRLDTKPDTDGKAVWFLAQTDSICIIITLKSPPPPTSRDLVVLAVSNASFLWILETEFMCSCLNNYSGGEAKWTANQGIYLHYIGIGETLNRRVVRNEAQSPPGRTSCWHHKTFTRFNSMPRKKEKKRRR
jgi:hypothetical protein